MARIEWLDDDVIIAVHDRQLAEHGGLSGLRDAGMLASALTRPKQLHAFGEPDIFDLAAAYAYGIARNHPFVDGNKRTAFVAARLLLRLHNFTLTAAKKDRVLTFLRMASGEISEDALAEWLRVHSAKLPRSSRRS